MHAYDTGIRIPGCTRLDAPFGTLARTRGHDMKSPQEDVVNNELKYSPNEELTRDTVQQDEQVKLWEDP